MYDFTYRKASSVEDAIGAVTGAEDGRFLAGGMTISSLTTDGIRSL